MEVSASAMSAQRSRLSILQSANRQPELAGELISKTIEGMRAAQSLQAPAQPLTIPPREAAPGRLIDIYA